MDPTDQFMLVAGSALAVIAGIASLAERRRVKRRDLERVGFMPWNAIFFVSFLGAVLLIGLGGRHWLTG
ncbi:hypothetical protein HT136_14980 [Novosphingobium profundi]|uniref:hypothetical protein n=1 Tax=Novosphingobium profundi TaxID=1774954 RepID=UPI001BDA928F|nr:hypothetical protein [Novosphingobium profundi]MBT0669670.1 hypothetical protein [Novosphingobium profundi]